MDLNAGSGQQIQNKVHVFMFSNNITLWNFHSITACCRNIITISWNIFFCNKYQKNHEYLVVEGNASSLELMCIYRGRCIHQYNDDDYLTYIFIVCHVSLFLLSIYIHTIFVFLGTVFPSRRTSSALELLIPCYRHW